MKGISERKYAYAVDLGSTTIDTAIVEIETGKRLMERSFKNRQSLYGSDIINRILAASRDKKKLTDMKTMVSDDLKGNAQEMLDDLSLKKDDIKKICISGNAVMISILLEFDIESMGHAPFDTRLHESVVCASACLFADDFFCGAQLVLTGTASAFIGGDVLAGMALIEQRLIQNDKKKLTLDRNNDKTDNPGEIKNWMLLDFGTNGEMVLCASGNYFATSASCGPAFEGALRKQHVYGSGALSAIALGLRTKNILKNGALKPPFDETGITISNVRLNSDIVREILLAKAAIRTGIDFLLDEACIDADSLDAVYLAGGFGFYLDLDTAYYLGLLPKTFARRVIVIGNASLAGACCICRDSDFLSLIDDYIVNHKIKVLQLADKENYQEALMENTYFAEGGMTV
ncbi:MAG: ASKHA domain-containing protein [Clostridium sp.]|nr:ASKHA domain-containing protein [Clostridium sp.]